jgi:hypothetical protein
MSTTTRLTTRHDEGNLPRWSYALSNLGTTTNKVNTSGALTAEALRGWAPRYGQLGTELADELAGLVRADLVDAVVYSYGTPIALRIAGTWVLPRAAYSRTTTCHQSLICKALAIEPTPAGELLAAGLQLAGRAARVATVLVADWNGTPDELADAARALVAA